MLSYQLEKNIIDGGKRIIQKLEQRVRNIHELGT